MAQGKLGRSVGRYPATQRRRAKYANSRYGQRGRGLPPHLMPGVRNQRKKESPLLNRRTFLIGFFGLGLTLILSFLAITITSAVTGAWAIVREYRKVNKSLPAAGPLFVNSFQTTRFFDRNGSLLQEIEHPDYGWRTFISMDQMTQDFIDATVAAEDATFWTNYGVEPVAFVRAGMIMFTGAGSSGASTITQQLVRTTYPEVISAQDYSVDRKLREAMAAVAMAQQYSKEDIFTMYVNQIFYGNRSFGVEAAANTYFNKHASELTLAESSFLAGIPQQPTAFTPTTDEGFNRAKNRQGYVLDQMQKLGYINKAQRKEAWEEPLQVIREPREGLMKAAPHFTRYMHDYLEEHFGEEALYGGLNVYTSIDLDLQAEAEEVIRVGIANVAQYNRNNAALVALCPWNGEILAMVGSAGFNDAAIDGQVNYATSGIQPGSSMKPIAYAAAFEEGWHPGYVYMDVPTTWEVPGQEDYAPNNYSRLFYGAVNIRKALANSFNIGAVKATEYAGVAHVMDVAHRMGMKTSLDQDPSFYGVALGLGSGEVKLLEHTNVYATFANNGKYVPVTPLQRIEDSQGNLLYETTRESTEKVSEQAIQSGIAYQITSILTDTVARRAVFGENNALTETANRLNRPTAAKSGTTENWRDLWTMGYSTACAVGVWVGKSGDGGSALDESDQIDGTPAAGPIFGDMMDVIHNNAKYAHLIAGPDGQAVAKAFPVPDDVSEERICEVTGHKPDSSDTTEEWIAKGLEPTLACNEMSDWEEEQLNNALKQVDKGAKWAEGAESSILRYAAKVGVRDAVIEQIDEDQDTSNSDTSDSTSDNSDSGDDVPIEPINPDDSDDSGN